MFYISKDIEIRTTILDETKIIHDEITTWGIKKVSFESIPDKKNYLTEDLSEKSILDSQDIDFEDD